jgi:DNA polymerase
MNDLPSKDNLDDLQPWYLQAMGIEQWELRVKAALHTNPSDEGASSLPSIAEMDWAALAEAVKHCQRCPLYATRTQAVFGVGDQNADLLIIGEAPGANEDKQGEPFVGRAGQLLNAMLQSIDLNRSTVYIANILKSRPPQNRDPRPEEVAACTPYLLRQITLIQPKVLLALGRIAAQYLLSTTTPMSRLRGQLFDYGPLQTPLLVTYHPAYLLRSPREKRKVWQDMQALKNLLNH